MTRVVVYLHGVGGPNPRERWLTPLNIGLRQQGISEIDETVDTIIEPRYNDVFTAPSIADTPSETWRRPERDEDYLQSRADYMVRRHVMEDFARRHEQRTTGVHFGHFPRIVSESVGPLGARLLPDAHRYRSSREVRVAVWRTVLDALPEVGELVLIGHSLGSVVALDILKRLPEKLHVDLLLTLGTPLAINGLWKDSAPVGREFPYDRVGVWVNVYDPRDPVTSGRGLTDTYPAAVDVPVDPEAHDVSGYCAHPATSAVLGRGLYGFDQHPVSTQNPARTISKDWYLQLLAFAFTNQLSRTCDRKKFKWKLRLDAARRLAVKRLLDEVGELAQQEGHEEALDVPPNEGDFLHAAADLIRDQWSDEELMPFAVSLYLSPPVPPFDIDVHLAHRQDALTEVLNRIRRRQGDLTDRQYAKAIADAVAQAKDDMGVSGGGRELLLGLLLGGGVLVLALTGVGLLAAAPAGLAGAAAITATLAAFGPGGMVGGMVTLAAATGAGTALLGAGAGSLASESTAKERWTFTVAGALMQMNASQLKGVIVGMLAVVGAQKATNFDSSREHVERVLVSAHSMVAAELAEHELVAPDRPGTKQWREKLQALDLGLRSLESKADRDVRGDVRRAIEAGESQRYRVRLTRGRQDAHSPDRREPSE